MISSAERLSQAAEYARLAREAEGKQMRGLVRDARTGETMAKFAAQLEALAVLERAEKAPPKRG